MIKILKGIPLLFFGLITTISWGQQRSVEGTVTDDKGVPLPGVSVVEKGTSNGTVTDFDGDFSLNIPQ